MVERQLVEFDVTGVDERAGRRAHTHSERVGDRMGHRHEFEVERAHLELVAAFDLDRLGLDVVLLALGLHKAERQLGADERNVLAQLEQVGHAADVVFVAMREHERIHLVEAVLDVVEVGQDQVDARLLLFGEEHAAVDEQDVAVVFDHVHVAADFAKATERHDAHRALAVLRRGDAVGVVGVRRGELLALGGVFAVLRRGVGALAGALARGGCLGTRLGRLRGGLGACLGGRLLLRAAHVFARRLFLCFCHGVFVFFNKCRPPMRTARNQCGRGHARPLGVTAARTP